MKHEPGGIVYDAYVRLIYIPIDSTFWDPMHILVASSGVGQYEGNGFLYVAVHEFGVSLEDIDAWSKELRWPARNTTACVKVLDLCVCRGCVLIEYEMCPTHHFFEGAYC